MRRMLNFTGLSLAGRLVLASAVLPMSGLVLFPVEKAVAQNSAPVVNRILVDGNKRIEADTIRSYMTLKAGDRVSGRGINNSLKALFATGLFKDVNIGLEGQDLVITVEENPVINRIAFEGNGRLKDEELSQEVDLRPRVVVTRKKVQAAVDRLLQVYRRNGRFAATIEPKMIELSDNRVDLVFEVNEGEVTGIRSIKFVGNNAFTDGDLKGEIATAESRWYRFLSGTDRYDPDRLAVDREMLRRFYRGRGYAEFRVVNSVAELSRDKKEFYVTFAVDEGGRYDFGDITISSEMPDLDVDTLYELLKTESGDRFDADDMEKSVQALTDGVGNLGYAFTDVVAETEVNKDTGTVDVSYLIKEGEKIYVERIDIINNVRTHDKVIRREFRLVEGDAYNTAKIRRSLQRIQRLGFFKNVDLKQERGSAPDKVVLVADVEEQSTGSFSIGAGLSSDAGVSGSVGLSESNFLGRGQKLSAKVAISSNTADINLSFTEPWFLDRELAAGFDIFNGDDEFDTFDRARLGGTLRASYPLSEELRHAVFYTLEDVEITNVKSSASFAVRESAGAIITSSIGHRFSYVDIDDLTFPREGYKWTARQTLAGLGGDAFFLQHDLSGSIYFPWEDQDITFGLAGEFGYIVGLGEDVRLQHRYQLGGRSFLGFEPQGIGPRAQNSGDDALGGNLKYVAKADVRFPLGLPDEIQMYGRAFTLLGSLTQIDEGSISSTQFIDDGGLRGSAGLGISWVSPVGPVTVDWAIPYLKADEDKTESFNFGFGTSF